jgi:hypothetical protein
MRREPEFFGDQELVLIHMARRLKEALRIEDILNQAGFDYAVQTGNFQSGVIFRSERVGAFFYVLPGLESQARSILSGKGVKLERPEPRA